MPSSSAVAATARPSSSRPTSSASKPRKPSRSASPSPATAPNPSKNAPGSSRRRSPLSDLNSEDAAASAARPGCFRFLLSTAASGTRSRSSSAPRTPARPDPPKARRRDHRVPDQESRTRAERCAAPCQEQRRRGLDPTAARIRRPVPAVKKQWLAQQQQQYEALTPEKKADSGSSAPASSSSGATPPVHASISPEVGAFGGSATPACFAAGHHVVPGVADRRKCRPRGILAIAGEGAVTASDGPDAVDPSRASIHWLSSPSAGQVAGTCSTKCGNDDEASVNWLVSPRDEGVDLLEDEIFVPRCSLEDAFWQFSPDCAGLLGSPVLAGGLLDFGTPASEPSGTTASSSGFLPVQKTPSSGDSISPFSLIVKRASASSRVSSLCAQQGLGLRSSYRHGSAADLITVSSESWSESVSNGACSGLTRTGSRPMKVMDPVVECLEMMSLSPRPGDPDYDGNGALPAPLPELSFQFAGGPMTLESIDLTTFKRSPRDIGLMKGKKDASFQKTRISWRDGLVSRMFDMDDLGCCKWLSDDEEVPVLSHNVEEALPDIKIQPGANYSMQKEGGDHPVGGGFGSVEFSCIDVDDELNNDRKAYPNNDCKAVAESMRAEGFELVSSDDSDWTLFYKNNLFQK